MGIIFLNFTKNIESAKQNKKSFWSFSLQEQFDSLMDRLPPRKIKSSSLQSFIEQCFPTGFPKRYYISCPNFRRERETQNNGTTLLNNIVIRPELTETMRNYLPNHSNVILFGDIQESDKYNYFIVNGIEFIDDNISSSNDYVIQDQSYCCNAFEKGTSGYGKPFTRWTIDRVNFEQSIFTPKFMEHLLKNIYPISARNRSNLVKLYDHWTEYLTFRKKYLEQQSNRKYAIDYVEIQEGFSINKQTYRLNSSVYEDDLLVDHPEFRKGEQILLKHQVSDSEPTTLVRIDIDRNRKSFLADQIVGRNGKMINPLETELRSFTNDNIALSKNEKQDDEYNNYLKQSVALGDRYKFIYTDIAPNCEDIVSEFNQISSQAESQIREYYRKLIERETEQSVLAEKKRLDTVFKDILEKMETEYQIKLPMMKANPEDQDILDEIKRLIQNKKKSIEKNRNSELSQIKPNQIQYQEKKNEIELKYKLELITFENSIDITSLLLKKHTKEIEVFSNQQKDKDQLFLKQLSEKRRKELQLRYSNAMQDEISSRIVQIDEERERQIEERVENETTRRFSIFFKIDPDDYDTVAKIKNIRFFYIIYDNRAESSKLYRQQAALDNFYEGNVTNPYLSTYLFAPDELSRKEYDFSKWTWFLDSLNERQKETVQKAVSSKGLYLVQGPPGTGKTQVIAEIIGHLVKEGKKVLVASETHKAIDGVFDRLPLLPDIRPLRLIADYSRKDSNFKPENLVDNFYVNIARNMKNVIKNYEQFEAYTENFKEKFHELKLLNDRIDRHNESVRKTELKIESITEQINEFKSQRQKLISQLDAIFEEKDVYLRTIRHLERSNFNIEDDIDGELVSSFINECRSLIDNNSGFRTSNFTELVRNSLNIDSNTLNEEIRSASNFRNELKIEQEKIEIKNQLEGLRDEYGDWLPNSEETKYDLQKRLKDIISRSEQKGDFWSELRISSIIHLECINDPHNALKVILEFQSSIIDIRNRYYRIVEEKISKIDNTISEQEKIIENINSQINDLNRDTQELVEDSDYKLVRDDEYKLRREIEKFVETFGISVDYQSFSEAIEFIGRQYDGLVANFNENQSTNKKRIPIYRKISNYLSAQEVIDADRVEYTKKLYQKANLFGITTTSRDRFDEKSMDGLEKYNLGTLDIRKQGVDVVIIDEVSKSSFIELLIPILYGKSIILVGDHRQLPPMYQYRNLRKEDFEHIDESILTKDQNDGFTKLYEECFFKTLFERVPDDYKSLLTKQYRSHEHIMQVYNCFYNNQLEMGMPGQNSLKEHYLSIYANNRAIIEPNRHVYFVNCHKFENRDADSTSIYNHNEAEVVLKLINLINHSYQANPNYRPIYNDETDERMSIGVICTYGDQARIIKQKMKNTKITTDMFNRKNDSKLIISTVDDFQGDQRDIIILSMVRNPEKRAMSNPGFVTAYQRINVALSRARRLLIVVGNRSYLEDKGIIDLPDVFGNSKKDQKDFHVYREVIGSIAKNGRIIDDEDVLGGDR